MATKFAGEYSRELGRLDVFRRHLQGFREGEDSMMARVLGEVMQEHRGVHERHEVFKEVYQGFIKDQNEASEVFFREFQVSESQQQQ